MDKRPLTLKALDANNNAVPFSRAAALAGELTSRPRVASGFLLHGDMATDISNSHQNNLDG